MRNWTEDQRTAIDARTGALVLSAAAGSGKTAVLTERAVARMTDERDPVDADRLLIVTFTRAAAAEMRVRVNARLAELRLEQPNNPLLIRQQILLQRAQISTIHAFCSTLLRKYYAYVNLTPDFRIAEEAQLNDLRSRAADEVIEEFYAEGDPAFHALVELLSTPRDDRGLVRTLLKLYEFILSHPFPDEWLAKQVELYDPEIPVSKTVWATELLNGAREGLAFAERQCALALDLAASDQQVSEKYGITLNEDQLLLTYLRTVSESGNWEAFTAVMREETPFGTLSAIRNYTGCVKDRVKALRENYKKVVTDLRAFFAFADDSTCREDISAHAPLMRKLAQLTQAFRERYDAFKLERGWLDYNDLEHFALKLLCVRIGDKTLPTELAFELSEQYREVMVDEYQDCNATQDMLFQAVSGEGAHLFVVGDVKQSIYGFRQAMPEIFLRRLQNAEDFDGESSPARLFLSSNFRSAKGIVQATNFLFGQLMSCDFGGLDYDETQALVYGADRHCPEPSVEVRLLDTAEAGERATEAEYRYLVELADELVQSGRLIEANGELRPVRYGDIAILMRTGSNSAPALAKRFEDAGTSCWYDSTGGYFDAREVQTMLSLLRAVDNPSRDLPMLGYLLSPLGRFTPDDIARLRVSMPKARLYKAMLAAARQGDEACTRVIGELRGFRTLAASLSAVRLVRSIYEQTHFLDIVRAGEDGERRCANLLLLVEYAAKFCELGGSTLTDFLRFLDRMQERVGDLESAQPRNAPENAVRIMSIHRSKGLQFPVTIVAGLSKPFNREDTKQRTCIHAKLGLSAVRVGGSRNDRLTTLPHEALKQAIWRDTLDEELRMLYVAATRAESLLIFTVAQKDPAAAVSKLALSLPERERTLPPYALRSAQNSAQWLLLAMLRHPDAACLRGMTDQPVEPLPRDGEIAFRVVKMAEAAPDVRVDAGKPAFALRLPLTPASEEYRERFAYRYPYEDAVHFPSKMTVTQIAKGASGPVVELREPVLASAREFTAAERGTFLHRFLQFARYDEAREHPEEERERLIQMGYLTEREAACVDLRKVVEFLSSPLVRTMQHAPVFRREFQFLRYESACDLLEADERYRGERVAVQGMVDCLYGDERHLVCVDYKTDHITDVEAFLNRYRPQLAMYETAVSEAFGIPVTACLLYSFSLHRVFCVRGTPPEEADV